MRSIEKDTFENETEYESVKGKTCLVSGGNGFLGRHLVEYLSTKLSCKVLLLDIIEPTFELPDRVEFVKCDLTVRDQVLDACSSKPDVVFHCATPNPFTPNEGLLFDVNVNGTRNMLEACEALGIEKFVFTSSASVVFDGKDQYLPREDDVSYPDRFRDTYSLTKAMAEKQVLEFGHSSKKVATIAIRPHGIFGPRDVHFFPTLMENARKNKTKFQIGDGSNVVDFTYVGNVVHALLLAGNVLTKSSKVNGKAYFITNDEPITFWDMLSLVLIGLGKLPPYIPIPYWICYVGSIVVEQILHLVQTITEKRITSAFTPSKVQLAGLSHCYSCVSAAQDLGYKPIWNMQQGLLESFEFFKQDSPKKAFRTYTKEQVAEHNTKDDVWIIVKDRVYDVSEYVEEHPGGDAILNNAGKDSTKGVYGAQHPPTVIEHLEYYCIGKLQN